MVLIRSVMYFGFLLLSSFFFGIGIVTLRRIASYRHLCRVAGVWARANLAALSYLCKLNFRISGAENLPSVASIVLCKHQSTWETIALRAVLPLEQTWVLKEELTRLPIFGWALKCLEPIAIDRSSRRKAILTLLKVGIRSMEGGRSVVIFPEGTRVRVGERGTYNIGGALLAERSGRPVVPIAHNAGEFWGRRSFLKSPGTIDLVIGPSIATEGRPAAEINRAVEEWIEMTVARLPTCRQLRRVIF